MASDVVEISKGSRDLDKFLRTRMANLEPQRLWGCQEVLTEWFVLRTGGRRSPERRFDGLASLEVKVTFCHPAKNQSDKTFGNPYNMPDC